MVHKMHPKHMHKLDSEKRRKDLPPEKTLKTLLLEEDNYIADIGCGIGYFSIPASKIVGEHGKVFSIDISDEMLEELSKRIKEQNIKNIEIVKGEESNSKVLDNSFDYLFLSNVVHEVENRNEFLKFYLNKLKKDGRIAIIEWKKLKSEHGPRFEERISVEEITQILKENSINIIKEIDLNKYHYGIVGSKL